MTSPTSISTLLTKNQFGFRTAFNPAYDPASALQGLREFNFPKPIPFEDVGVRPLSIRVLKTAAEKAQITHLRHYADCASEYELDPGLAEKEALKDEIGIVTAIYLEQRPIATIRFVPTGYDCTLTERLWRNAVTDEEIIGPNSFEVGRLIMAPEDRRADLLPKCLALALGELLKLGHVQHLHASCLTKMARLYRRFGFKTLATLESKDAKECALIHGKISEIATALKVDMPATTIQRNVGLSFVRQNTHLHFPTIN